MNSSKHLQYSRELQEESSWSGYQKDRENLQVSRTETGYEVANLRTGHIYSIGKYDGYVTCSCPDFRYRGKWSIRKHYSCKHKIALFFYNEEQKRLRALEVDRKVEEIQQEAKTETCLFCAGKFKKSDMRSEDTCNNCAALMQVVKEIKTSAPAPQSPAIETVTRYQKPETSKRPVTISEERAKELRKIIARW